MRILLIDDDDTIAKALKKVLTDEHYAVDVASDGQAGWQLVSSFDYDLIVLDVVLPKLDGFEFCRRLREQSYNMPVLLITALDSSTKKIAGLNAGADDYITKPFELEEFLARIRVLLRRVKTPVLSTLEWGQLCLEPNGREVHYGEICLNLTPKEYGLLELFLRNPSQVFSRGAILDSLWSCNEAPGEDTVTAHVKGLRRKLTEAGAPNDLIKTVYGVGYRLSPIELATTATDLETSPRANALANERKRATHRQKTQVALAGLWQSAKFRQIERLAILKQAVQALEDELLPHNLRQSAAQAAHSLAGALGLFGLSTGSDLARAIEQILQGTHSIHSQDQKQLFEFINALEAALNQALHQRQEARIDEESPPLLVIIDDNQQLLLQVSQAIQTQGLTAAVLADEGALQGLRSQLTVAPAPADQASELKQLEICPSPSDVALLNVSLTHLEETTLKQLSQLINQIPPMLVLVGSANGSLANRIKAAHLGNHFFLQNPDVTQLLNSIIRVRSQLQHPTNKVLAVDDDPAVLSALRARLEPQGLELVTLNQPLEFWPTLQAADPDLLLLDIEMPKFDGFELCRAVRQAPVWNQLPIVFFTAHSDATTKAAALQAGANDLVEKSLIDSDLLARLCDQLKRSQLRQAMTAIGDGNFPN